MNVKKMAARDAAEWAAAEMFYGEGAGVRRRHTAAEISEKVESVNGYEDAFKSAYSQLDMNHFAKQAIKERKRVDRGKAVRRNVRGVATGNRQSMTTSVAVFVGLAYFAHQTGMDKTAMDYAAKKYYRGKHYVKVRYAEWKLKQQPKL